MRAANHISSARVHLSSYLVAGYALLIVYASLSPFSGWQEQGLTFSDVLSSPLLRQYTWFDVTANVLAYLPFGMLLCLALRYNFGAGWSVLLATLGGIAMSAAMEYAQMYLPVRNSSNLDLLCNSIGALAGALLAASIAPRAWFGYLVQWRIWLFHGGSDVDFGLALVALWVFAQINPSLPMLGSVFISEGAHRPFIAVAAAPFSWLESAAVTLNLLMLGVLLLTLLRGRHLVQSVLLVLFLVALAKFVAAAVLLKSWALLLWLNGEAVLGIAAGLLVLAFAERLPLARLRLFGVGVTLAYLILAHGVLDSGVPAAAMRLYQWNYGHLLNYNGLSQTIALIFPVLLLTHVWRTRSRQGMEL